MRALNEELEKINVDITLDFSIIKAIIIILFPAEAWLCGLPVILGATHNL